MRSLNDVQRSRVSPTRIKSVWFRRNAGQLSKYARRLERGASSGADLMGDAAVEYLKAPIPVNGESHFVARFVEFLKNTARTRNRRASAAKRGGGQEPAPLDAAVDVPAPTRGPATDAERIDMVHTAEACMGRLEPAARELIKRRLYRGQSFQEIAEALSLPNADAAQKRYARAIDRLRSMVVRHATAS